MKRADFEAMQKRLADEIALSENELRFLSKEIDRAVRKARKEERMRACKYLTGVSRDARLKDYR